MSLIKKPYKVITSKDISAIEKKHTIELPEDYKAFLLKTNGGKPSTSVFDIPKQGSSNVQMFYAMADDKIWGLENHWQNLRDALPVNLIPIGRDDGGNQICLGVAASNMGKVFFWDHEVPGKKAIVPLKKNFKQFFDSLYDEKEQSFDFIQLADKGDTEAFQKLISEGWDVNTADKMGRTALERASLKNHIELIKLLLLNDAKVQNIIGSLMFKGNYEVVKLLIDNKYNIEEIIDDEYTPLLYATMMGNYDMVKYLVSKGANINAKDGKGDDALEIAKIKMDGDKEIKKIINILEAAKAKRKK